MVAATKHPWPRPRKPVQLQSVERLWLSAVGMLLMSQNDVDSTWMLLCSTRIGHHAQKTLLVLDVSAVSCRTPTIC